MADQDRQRSGGFNPIGLCMGLSVGLCFGTAMDNLGLGIALGMGVGLCFCVALGQNAGQKKDENSGEEQK